MEDEEKKINLALLIDSDNVSAKYITSILSLLSKYGKITIRRMYGDWSQDRLRPWLNRSATYSLEPIMQMNNTPGKNASDIGLIIDAMDILYRNTVGGFCIVSSDGDFNKLAKRLRESGKMVIGMGEKKTPESFRASCERFIFLDVDGGDSDEELASAPSSRDRRSSASSAKTKKTTTARGKKTGTAAPLPAAAASASGTSAAASSLPSAAPAAAALNEPPASAAREHDLYHSGAGALLLDGADGTDEESSAEHTFTDKAVVEKAIIDMITDNSADGKDTSLGEIGSRLQSVFPEFDAQNYGYSKLMNFVKDFASLCVTTHNNHVYVSLNGSSDSDIEQQIHRIFDRHRTNELNLGLLKEELTELNPNLNATIRRSGVTRFNVYLNRNIHSVEVNGSSVTLLTQQA
ncbi:NYN domain-containing protein [Lachnoclostridium sp. Marseille-P6806]|uniref:NYN domain-containing protein n=1 Tax=Lachnoclostridium sp. Marseille-P6806 TaxID=2364793 RepID=UPI0013EF24A6|nr:NYN domain-containing protein [Lachnoclostridium sp. Marseille-P6806]